MCVTHSMSAEGLLVPSGELFGQLDNLAVLLKVLYLQKEWERCTAGSKAVATVQVTQTEYGYTRRRSAAWPAQSGCSASIVQTFKKVAQQRISLMELMTRIGTTGIGIDDP